MSDATVALLGIAVGALLTGGFQQLAAWLERRRHARVAARVLYVSLTEPGVSLSAVLEKGAWTDFRSLTPAIDAWARHREQLAHGVSGWQWHAIAGAFDTLPYMEELRAGAHREGDPERAWGHAAPHLDESLVRIQRGLDLLWAAGAGWRGRTMVVRKMRSAGVHKIDKPFRLPRTAD